MMNTMRKIEPAFTDLIKTSETDEAEIKQLRNDDFRTGFLEKRKAHVK